MTKSTQVSLIERFIDERQLLNDEQALRLFLFHNGITFFGVLLYNLVSFQERRKTEGGR